MKELTEQLKTQSVQLLSEAPSGQLLDPENKSARKLISKADCLRAYVRCAADSEEVRNEIELEF